MTDDRRPTTAGYSVETKYPIALDSIDHTDPFGTMLDNSVLPEFNERLMEIVTARPLSVLDLGCAGGGMVKSFLDMGQTAIGIEGSDYSLKHKRAEWATIPKNLFCADARKPFQVLQDGQPMVFDVVTAWEFWEHIDKPGLDGVMDNIRRHLKPGGLLVGSINSIGYHHHVTVRKPVWWIEYFERQGLIYRRDLWERIDPHWLRTCKGSFWIVFEL